MRQLEGNSQQKFNRIAVDFGMGTQQSDLSIAIKFATHVYCLEKSNLIIIQAKNNTLDDIKTA